MLGHESGVTTAEFGSIQRGDGQTSRRSEMSSDAQQILTDLGKQVEDGMKMVTIMAPMVASPKLFSHLTRPSVHASVGFQSPGLNSS